LLNSFVEQLFDFDPNLRAVSSYGKEGAELEERGSQKTCSVGHTLFSFKNIFIEKKKKHKTLYTTHSLSAILGQGVEDKKEEGRTPFGPATLFEQRQRQYPPRTVLLPHIHGICTPVPGAA
jgi:hypothetical protein